MKQRTKCFIYTRVSTSMQVDGYSLDGQKDRLRKYADYQDYQIVGEYSDEGKSGKNVEGRPEFLKMLRDIESGEYGVSFVLVFKLSRFGRNAADVLTSLQRMQDYGVNLICVEDGIDSSKDAGKLMISVLSAVAEIERENILVQTMEGRRQKAREGKWNGGFAPYGYKLENGELLIEPDEAEVVKIIFDKYTTTPMGTQKIAYWLNEHGYRKIQRHNNKLEAFTGAFVVGVIDNPVYFGKIAYGRRHNEKIPGTRNEYHVVRTDDYMLVDGKHEPIIPEETWRAAHVQRESTNKKQPKTHSLDHEHILSSILRCPVCGCGMYGNVNRKKKGDGTYYKDYFYYACKHRLHVDGKRCDYHHQWGEDIIDSAVEEVIKKLVSNPQNEQALRDKIGSRIDTAELEKELEVQQKLLRQQTGTKDRLSEQIDNLDFDDPHYDRKFQDLQERQNRIYDLIAETEVKLANVQDRLENVRQQKVSADHVYQFLLYFDQLYDKFTDAEKKAFMSRFIESVEIYPERQPNGQILKHIEFAFPVYYKGNEMTGMSWDSEGTVETVAFLSKLRTAQHIDVDLDLTELAMREIYLRPFEIAVKEGGTRAVMSSFNRIGTRWVGGDWRLLTGILRNEWGFRGMVICDFNTSGQYMNPQQMAYAGGDLNLSATPTAWCDPSDTADAVILAQCAKNIMYTVVNSNAMNRIVVGYSMPRWQLVIFIVDGMAAAGLIAWLVTAIVRRKKRKAA